MNLQTDDKGKVFTEVIHKEGINVLIQTRTNQIKGTLHKRTENRTIDKLNSDKLFIPLTKVTLLDAAGKLEIDQTDFLAVNTKEIIWLMEKGN